MPERRNPVVRSAAILRKGGAHTKSVSGQRQRQRLRLDDAIDEWYEDTDYSLKDDSPQELSNGETSARPGKDKQQKSNKGQSKDCPSRLRLLAC